MSKEKMKFDRKCFLKILGIVLLFSLFLFPYNYCSDIYNVIDSGYWEYAKEWFAPAGRTVGMGVLFIFEMMHIPINLYIFIMKILAVFIATFSIYIFYKMVLGSINYDEKKDSSKNKCIFVAVILVFLNMGSYQYFYYAESAIMWLGVLFTVFAIKKVINCNDKLRYLKAFVLLFVAMNCYQATILFFIPATLLLLGIKKDKAIKIISETLKLSVIVGLCLILGYLILQGLTGYFNLVPYRNNIISFNKENILEVFKYLITQNHNKTGNNFIYLLINIFSVLVILFIKKKFLINKKILTVLTLILIITSAFVQTWAIVSVVDYYIADRIQFAYLSTVGMCMLFLIMYTKLFDYKKVINVCYICLILFLIYIIANANFISILNRYVRSQDKFEGETIAEAIEKYEKENNCEIEKVIYCLDNYVTYDCVNIKSFGDPTFRIFASPWVFESALKYYIGYDLDISQSQDVFEDVFLARNWNEFDERQIKFEGNTLYLCVY